MSGNTRKGKAPHRNGHGEPPPVVQLPVRMPPHNLDAERSLLGGVLLGPEAPLKELAAVCSSADFYREAHRKIYAAMLSLLEDGFPVDRVSLVDRLTARGDLEAAGGEQYVEQLDMVVPTASNLGYYARIIRDKARARRLIETASTIAQLGYEQHGDVADFLAEAERRVREVIGDGESKAVSLRSRIVRLTRDGLAKVPPPRKYMLKDANTGRGVFLQGFVGFLAGAGGSGKSSAFGQLGVALSTGLTWFGPGGWSPVAAMRVLLLAGEDDEEEIDRRIYYSAKALGAVSDEDLDMIARNLHAIPLAGYGCALTADDAMSRSTLLPETAFAVAVRELIREEAERGVPYGCILIDPLSRFAGFDTEKDNASATRWIQVVETFTKAEFGRPAVIASHHTKKRNGDFRGESIDLIRGASALKDGARWAAVLEQQKRTKDSADLLTLRIEKANGVPPQREPLILCRPENGEGVLRIATPAEIATNQKLSEGGKSNAQKVTDYQTRVLEVVKPGQSYTRNEIVTQCGGKRELVLEAIRQLLIHRPDKPAELTESKKRHIALSQPALVPAGSLFREPPVQAVPLSGSGSPVPSPSSAFKPRGDREPENQGAAGRPIQGKSSNGSPTGSLSVPDSREPLDDGEPPPPTEDCR